MSVSCPLLVSAVLLACTEGRHLRVFVMDGTRQGDADLTLQKLACSSGAPVALVKLLLSDLSNVINEVTHLILHCSTKSKIV